MGIRTAATVMVSLMLAASILMQINLAAHAAEPSTLDASDTVIETIEFDPNFKADADQRDPNIHEVKLTTDDRKEVVSSDPASIYFAGQSKIDRKPRVKKWVKVAAISLLILGATTAIILLCTKSGSGAAAAKGGGGGGGGGNQMPR